MLTRNESLARMEVVEQSACLIVEERQRVLGFRSSSRVDSGADESDGRTVLLSTTYERSVAH